MAPLPLDHLRSTRSPALLALLRLTQPRAGREGSPGESCITVASCFSCSAFVQQVMDSVSAFWEDEHELRIPMVHIWGCESDQEVHAFDLDTIVNQRPGTGDRYYRDASQFRNGKCLNVVTQTWEKPPSPDILHCGFLFSKPQKTTSGSAAQDPRAWSSVYGIVCCVRPVMVHLQHLGEYASLEDVKDSDISAVLSDLHGLGYVTSYWLAPAHELGSPIKRTRFLVVGILAQDEKASALNRIAMVLESIVGAGWPPNC